MLCGDYWFKLQVLKCPYEILSVVWHYQVALVQVVQTGNKEDLLNSSPAKLSCEDVLIQAFISRRLIVTKSWVYLLGYMSLLDWVIKYNINWRVQHES